MYRQWRHESHTRGEKKKQSKSQKKARKPQQSAIVMHNEMLKLLKSFYFFLDRAHK